MLVRSLFAWTGQRPRTAVLSVASPPAPTVDPALRCTLARWDVRVNGTLEPAPDGGATFPIHTSANPVNGAILSRTN